MMDAPHIGFVIAAYALATVVIVGMVAAVLIDYRGLTRQLAALETKRGPGEAS